MNAGTARYGENVRMIRPRLSVGARYQIRVTMYQLEAGDLPQRPRALYIAAAPATNIHE